MKLRDLDLFLAVAEEGSLTRAAAALGMGQPNLSRTLKALEARLGVRLVIRTGYGVTLTDAGRAFRDFARRTSADYRETMNRIDALSDGLPAEIRIGVPLRMARLFTQLLQEAAAQLSARTVVRVFEFPTNDIPGHLLEGRLDIGLFHSPPTHPELNPEEVWRESLFLIGTEDLVQALPEPVTLADVAPLPLVMPGPDTAYFKWIERTFALEGLDLRVVRQADITEAMTAYMERERLAGILPYGIVYREAEDGALAVREIGDPRLRRSLMIAVGRQSNLGDPVGLVRRLLSDLRVFRESRGWR